MESKRGGYGVVRYFVHDDSRLSGIRRVAVINSFSNAPPLPRRANIPGDQCEVYLNQILRISLCHEEKKKEYLSNYSADRKFISPRREFYLCERTHE